MGPKNPAEVIPDHPSKICYRPVRVPLPLEEQSDIVKVSPRRARSEGAEAMVVPLAAWQGGRGFS